MVIFYSERSLLASLVKNSLWKYQLLFFGSKAFPEQCIIPCPKCAIKGFESLLKHVWQVSAVT